MTDRCVSFSISYKDDDVLPLAMLDVVRSCLDEDKVWIKMYDWNETSEPEEYNEPSYWVELYSTHKED